MNAPKILVVGAGQVGTSTIRHLLSLNTGHIKIYDYYYGLAKGSSIDLSHCIFNQNQCQCEAMEDLSEAMCDIDLVVFTAGIPRKPNQQRIDLLAENAKIALKIAKEAHKHNPEMPFLLVTNPVDVLSTVVKRVYPKMHVIGMGCGLDSVRLQYYISQYLKKPVGAVHALMIGSHDELMVPLWNKSLVYGAPVAKLTDAIARARIFQLVKSSGDRIVTAQGRGSALAAGVLCGQMVHSYFNELENVYSADCFLNDCFGAKDCMISLPCILSQKGTKIIDSDFSETQQKHLTHVAKQIDISASKILDILK